MLKTFRVVAPFCVLGLFALMSQAYGEWFGQNYEPVQILINGEFVPSIVEMVPEKVARQRRLRDRRRARRARLLRQAPNLNGVDLGKGSQ